MAAQRGLSRASAVSLQAAAAAAALAAGQQPDGAMEVERHVPGPAAGQGTQRADGIGARSPVIPLKLVTDEIAERQKRSKVERNLGLELERFAFCAAFIAGVLSFISPCVLPLIPGYLSFISGVSLDEMRGTPAAAVAGGGTVAVAPSVAPAVQRRVIVTSLFFILGFSLVFVSLGASATVLGTFLMERLTVLGKIAGVVIIIFGLHTMGVLRIGWLYREKRFQSTNRPTEHARRDAGRHCVRVRLDAVHRPDPGRAFSPLPRGKKPWAKAFACWPSTRPGLPSRF